MKDALKFKTHFVESLIFSFLYMSFIKNEKNWKFLHERNLFFTKDTENENEVLDGSYNLTYFHVLVEGSGLS